MTAVDAWLASQRERLELMQEEAGREIRARIAAAQSLDPTGRGAIPICPKCNSTMRYDIDRDTYVCDFDGDLVPRWERYPADDDRAA